MTSTQCPIQCPTLEPCGSALVQVQHGLSISPESEKGNASVLTRPASRPQPVPMIKECCWNGSAVVCKHCGSPVENTFGKANTDQLAYIVKCPVCDAPRGEWFTPQERDEELAQMRI